MDGLEKNSTLHVVAASNFIEAFDALLNKGVILSTKNSNGMTPLHVAATAGYKAFNEKLLEKRY